MTDGFAAEFKDKVIGWRDGGVTKAEALRMGELDCGKNNEEFRDGRGVIDAVYDLSDEGFTALTSAAKKGKKKSDEKEN